jgi:hypothetical protein
MLNNIEAAKALVEHGADIFAKNYHDYSKPLPEGMYLRPSRSTMNKTAKEIALKAGHIKLAQYLQTKEEEKEKKESAEMIQIRNLTLTDKTLTLNYRVSNPFEYDIWICEDIDIYSKYDVETRIDNETVRIKLRSNLETNIWLEVAPLAKYRLLSPGDSHSGKILLNLPIRNASPVYDFDEDRKKHRQIVLKRAVFEVGYFEGKYINMISETIEKFKRGRPSEEIQNTQFNPRIEEEIEDGQSYQFLYCSNLWPGLSKEKFAEVLITDVDIPCSVVVDDK